MSDINAIGLHENSANQLAEKLNELLANYQIFYMNARGYHWNVKGPNFFELHTKFEENYHDLDFLPVTDEAYLSSLIETAARSVAGFSRVSEIMKEVERRSDRLSSTLAELPMTLLQGDVHPGNILQLPHGAVLVDWGNARIGPRTVDLTNITRLGDAAWTYYTSESARFGTITGPERMLEDRTWASAITNLMYLPAGAAIGESHAERMAAVVLESIRQLCRSYSWARRRIGR